MGGSVNTPQHTTGHGALLITRVWGQGFLWHFDVERRQRDMVLRPRLN